ncbi:MAG TPA: DMT family transporter, partial [Acidocella sp.]|nr:DMT family transporter [Acidocella sp.]
MRLFFLLACTMVAFAANSILTRMGLAEGRIGPAAFSAIRLASAAVSLAVLVKLRGRALPLRSPRRWRGVLALTVYVLGFSFAYLWLQAGVGALILFGAVQVTMFSAAFLSREPIPLRRLIGATIGFLGLILLMWPTGGGAPDPLGALLMAAAGIGWGAYSILGRGARDPEAETAANFLLAVPFGLLALLFTKGAPLSAEGIVLALTSGVMTSGLSYALWYRILPQLQTSTAAIAQLTVPVIAAAGGAVLMGETLSVRFILAASMVAGGVAGSLR